VTIGNYGCLITALTCLARLDDVSKVNDILKANNGFVNENGSPEKGTYLVWNAVSKIPNLTFKYRYYSYDNDKVKAIIEKNGGCIIEVDGTPIGGYKHWLLYIGNKQLLDPWDGKIKSTSSYTPLSFVDVEYMESSNMAIYKEFDLTNTDSMKSLVDFWTEWVKEGKLDKLKSDLKAVQQANDEMSDLYAEVVADNEDLVIYASNQATELLEQETEISKLTDDVNKRGIKITQQEGKIKDLELKLAAIPQTEQMSPTISNVIALFRLWLKGWLK